MFKCYQEMDPHPQKIVLMIKYAYFLGLKKKKKKRLCLTLNFSFHNILNNFVNYQINININ